MNNVMIRSRMVLTKCKSFILFSYSCISNCITPVALRMRASLDNIKIVKNDIGSQEREYKCLCDFKME